MSRRVVLPFLLALVGTLVVFAAARLLGTDDDPPPPTVATHAFDAAYAGPVWITVTSEARDPQDVTLRWGSWQRSVEHTGTEPVTYVFIKGGLDRGTPEEIEVELPAGGEVEFGQGLIPPADAVSLREGWVPRQPGPVPGAP